MSFFKQVLATMVGILVMSILGGVIFFATIVSIIASGDKTPSISSGSVLQINLQGLVADRVADDSPLSYVLGDSFYEQSLSDILSAIREAKTNPKIEAIFLQGGMIETEPANLQEIHEALVNFRESGKKIFAYGETYSQGAYYISSVADEIMLNPAGQVDWHGLSSQRIYYKDLLDKVGVNMQLYRVGKYKSYGEAYTRNNMSDESREQLTAMIGGIWSEILTKVSAHRKIPTDTLNAYADRYISFETPERFVTSGLVDTLCYINDAKTLMQKKLGVSKLNMVSPTELVANISAPSYKEGKVAVYFAEGSIVTSNVEGFSGESYISSDQMVPDIENLSDDESVKAVVLRINSPGGSAAASEMIWDAVRRLAKKKTVVVSMGGAAASGGYYIASAAPTIFADPTTITGSIGIFAMIPDAHSLLDNKIGLKFETVKTNASGDFLTTLSRPLTSGESAVIQAYVDRGYDLFLDRVAKGRKKTRDEVHEIAQGRVWTGAEAHKIGLVDKLGGLDNAIAFAAKKAGVKANAVETYPAPKAWYEDLLEDTKSNYFETQMREVLGDLYVPITYTHSLKGRDCIQTALPYRIDIR